MMDWTRLDWTRLDWNIDWTGLDWTGLDWTGLDWTGLDWTGLSSGLYAYFQVSFLLKGGISDSQRYPLNLFSGHRYDRNLISIS